MDTLAIQHSLTILEDRYRELREIGEKREKEKREAQQAVEELIKEKREAQQAVEELIKELEVKILAAGGNLSMDKTTT